MESVFWLSLSFLFGLNLPLVANAVRCNGHRDLDLNCSQVPTETASGRFACSDSLARNELLLCFPYLNSPAIDSLRTSLDSTVTSFKADRQF